MTTGNDGCMSVTASGYYTKIQWEAVPEWELWNDNWRSLRERFTALRQGDFSALDGLLEIRLTLKDPGAQLFVDHLLGDAGTDRHLKEVTEFVLDEVFRMNEVEELCHSLYLWGRLSCVGTLLTIFDRFFDVVGCVEKVPIYLSALLESEMGPVCYAPPRNCPDEEFFAYIDMVKKVWELKKSQLGGDSNVLWGSQFSVEKLAQKQRTLNDHGLYTNILRRNVRHRFEASTGINCSNFFRDGQPQPLTATAVVEDWLDSDAPSRFVPGERYFFGHRIP